MKIIVAGAIGRFPVGGQAWCEIQYLLGLRSLGHQVFFLEECGESSWVYHWEEVQITNDLNYPADYVRACLEPFGLGKNWIYRSGNKAVGMSIQEFIDVCYQADLLLIRGCSLPLWREEYNLPKRRIFIDSDPGFTQIRIANGDQELINTVERCERLFTIAQNVGEPSCSIPTLGKQWIATRFPVFLHEWPFVEDATCPDFTSVMQWKSYKAQVYRGIHYGNKDKEFPKFITLPQHTNQPICLALTAASNQIEQKLIGLGWKTVLGWKTSYTPSLYQRFIQTSRAEFGVAKQGYVASRGGWFSDRSVCYLASGR
ncbi:MAG: glycosyltransferase family 1 protein, partial [Moorea sp. SIO4G2]|nr:glycosyltransferase family 1 protein [Moorena sp. SIO4G2]